MQDQIDALEAALDGLRRELAYLRAASEPPDALRPPAAAMRTMPELVTARRNLLKVLGAATGMAVVGGVAGAGPAGAAGPTAAVGPGASADAIRAALALLSAAEVSFLPGGLLTSTDVQGALLELDGRLAGQLEAGPDLLRGHVLLYDDFTTTGVTSGLIGSLGWTLASSGGGTLAAASTGLANVPGWYLLQSGLGVGSTTALAQSSFALLGAPAFTWEARVQQRELNTAANAAATRVGLGDAGASGALQANGAYFEYSTGSTGWKCTTANAGVRTTTATAVPVVADAWTRLRIVGDGGGAVYFSVDGTVVATHTATIPTAGQGPFVAIRKTLGSSATLSLRVDYVYLRAAAIR